MSVQKNRFDLSSPEGLHEHFLFTGQEKLKLQDSLAGYFDPETPGIFREDYRGYLTKRIRQACDELVSRNEVEKIRILLEEGLLDEEGFRMLLSRSEDPENPAGWMALLRLRSRRKAVSLSGRETFEKCGRTVAEPAADDRKRLPEKAPAKPPVQVQAGKNAAGILKEARNELYALFPYLDGAIAGLTFLESDRTASAVTDGAAIYYNKEWVEETYRESAQKFRRGILHMLLHCMFFHVWDMAGEEPWAADLAVEFLIERECRRNERLKERLGALERLGLWSGLYDAMQGSIWSASRIRRELSCPDRLKELVHFDDHEIWKLASAGAKEEQKEKWNRIVKTAGEGEGRGFGKSGGSLGIGETTGAFSEEAGQIRKGRHDYRSFLHQFAVPGEEMELDLDSFDYIYYSLGMERYGNIPLIEPLEYREGHKLQELVIAIDTSGSCKLPMVRRFLEETYAILDEKENFFKKMNVWVIQCDCVIKDVAHICSRKDWDNYLRELKVKGRAGTDFRPVFRYVEKLKKQGDLKELKGLIYFTDGDGVYPRQAPPYQVAFAFVKEGFFMSQVPKWAQTLLVQ